MSSSEEVSQIDEFTMVFIFDVDDSITVFATSNLFAVDYDCLFGAYDGKGDERL